VLKKKGGRLAPTMGKTYEIIRIRRAGKIILRLVGMQKKFLEDKISEWERKRKGPS